MSSYTRGPWIVNLNYDEYPTYAAVGKICSWGGYPIAVIDKEVPEDNQVPNARLISAAPDLFESLYAMVELFDGYQRMELKTAKAALNKAMGETNAI